MKNLAEIRLEQYRLPLEEVFLFGIDADAALANSPNRLIGYDEYIDVFHSLIPYADYDDDGNFRALDDFPEIFPNAFPSSQNTSSAVIFAGQAGCGKHTADQTFMSVVLQSIQREMSEEMEGEYVGMKECGEALEIYRVPRSMFEAESERQLGQALDLLLEQLYQKAVSLPYMLYYFSFGSVNRVLESKRLSRRFADRIRRIMEDSRSRCIITCIYDGVASALRDDVKQPFYVLELEAPTKEVREEYFLYFLSVYHNIKIDMTAGELARSTEGFSFAMVKRLAAYLLMTAKREAKKKKLTVRAVRFEKLSPTQTIAIKKEQVRFYIDLLAKSRYVAPAAVSGFPVSYQGAPYAASPLNAADAPDISGSPRNDSLKPNDAHIVKKENETTKEAAERLEKGLQTFEQCNDMLASMMVPRSELVVVMFEKVFYRDGLEKGNITPDLFLDTCLKKGLTDLSNIRSAILDGADRLKLILMNDTAVSKTPLTPENCDYRVVVKDGKIENAGLKRLGIDQNWLMERLRENNIHDVSKVYLAILNNLATLDVFTKQ